MHQMRSHHPQINNARKPRRRCSYRSRAVGSYGSLNLGYDGTGNRTLLAPDNAASEDMRSYSYQNYTHHLAGESQGDAYTAHQYDWAGQLLGQATNVDDGNGGSTNTAQAGHSYDALDRRDYHHKLVAPAYDSAIHGPADEMNAPAPSTYRYGYNALGQRVRKDRVPNNNIYGAGEVARFYFYDAQGHLIAETNPYTGAVLAETVWLGDTPLTHFTRPIDAPLAEQGTALNPTLGLRPYSIHTDHLGTPQRLTTTQGVMAWQASYDPFGNTTQVVGNGPNNTASIVFNLRLPGQYFDAESGLHQNWNRDYDPSLGRYIQSDPIGLAGGINTYSYGLNNPISNIDPEGLTAMALPAPGAPAAETAIAAARAAAAVCTGTPAACAAAASFAGGAVAGSLIYPHVEPTITKAVDWCTTDSKEECRNRCDATHDEQIKYCMATFPTKTARRQCIENAILLYSQCLKDCK